MAIRWQLYDHRTNITHELVEYCYDSYKTYCGMTIPKDETSHVPKHNMRFSHTQKLSTCPECIEKKQEAYRGHARLQSYIRLFKSELSKNQPEITL